MELVQKSVEELAVAVKFMTTVLKGHLEDNQGHFENPVHGSIDDEAAAFSNPLGSMEVEARAAAIFSNPLEILSGPLFMSISTGYSLDTYFSQS